MTSEDLSGNNSPILNDFVGLVVYLHALGDTADQVSAAPPARHKRSPPRSPRVLPGLDAVAVGPSKRLRRPVSLGGSSRILRGAAPPDRLVAVQSAVTSTTICSTRPRSFSITGTSAAAEVGVPHHSVSDHPRAQAAALRGLGFLERVEALLIGQRGMRRPRVQRSNTDGVAGGRRPTSMSGLNGVIPSWWRILQ